MSRLKTKKAGAPVQHHTITSAGLARLNGEYRLVVSGRNTPLQLFQVAVPGVSTFRFFTLPRPMLKIEAVEFLIRELEAEYNLIDMAEEYHNDIDFLKGLWLKYDIKPPTPAFIPPPPVEDVVDTSTDTQIQTRVRKPRPVPVLDQIRIHKKKAAKKR